MVEEVEPSIRFCAYNLKRLGQSSGADDGMDADDDGVDDLLADDGQERVLGASEVGLHEHHRAVRLHCGVGHRGVRRELPLLAARPLGPRPGRSCRLEPP